MRVADHCQIAQDEQDAERKSTIGTGDRSERIRLTTSSQNRVTGSPDWLDPLKTGYHLIW